MKKYQILEMLRETDWASYTIPKWHKPDDYINILTDLLNLNDVTKIETTKHAVLYALGNNHCGSYYPVIKGALGIIIAIAEQDENAIAKKGALEVLYDLLSFSPDLEVCNSQLSSVLEAWVNEKLQPYNV